MVSWPKRRALHHHLIVCAARCLGSRREKEAQRCWFAAAICADCGFCSDSAATTIVHHPPTASTVDHLSLVPATRHTPSCPLSVATTVFLSGYHQPYFSQTAWLYFSHFFIFSPAPPLELIGGQGIVSESSFGKVAQRKTKFIDIVSNFYDNSKYGFWGGTSSEVRLENSNNGMTFQLSWQ